MCLYVVVFWNSYIVVNIKYNLNLIYDKIKFCFDLDFSLFFISIIIIINLFLLIKFYLLMNLWIVFKKKV